MGVKFPLKVFLPILIVITFFILRAYADIPSTINVFIGGASDSKKHYVRDYMNFIRDHSDGKINPNNSKYFFWRPEKDIYNWIKENPGAKINIIGYSYGGDTAATITSHLYEKLHRKVNLLITLDPVSIFRPNYAKVKNNSNSWVNVMADGPTDPTIFIGNRYRKDAKNFVSMFIVDKTARHSDVKHMMECESNGISSEKLLLMEQ